MKFADIHTHALFGVDDGAKNFDDMFKMIDAAYSSGTRIICFTPHYIPELFKNNSEAAEKAFAAAKEYSGKKYKDLFLFLGNELRYNASGVQWLKEGFCRTLNGSKCVLVDFPSDENAKSICDAMNSLLSAGYIPVLAHTERYAALGGKAETVQQLKDRGVIVQIDAGSVFGQWGFGSKIRCRKLLSKHLADIAASDAHNTSSRPPEMSEFYEFAKNKYSKRYADDICFYNTLKILGADAEKKAE